jgi:hypothetical protein
MKAVTEFPSFTLTKALAMKATLAGEGKTPDEIKENLGQNFKYEGEKLGYFMQSLEVATTHAQNLKRVMVVKLNEGEAAPAKATEVEGVCYYPEFLITAASLAPKADANSKGGFKGKGGKGGKSSGPKSSPWGLSPEEKAAKNKKPAAH